MTKFSRRPASRPNEILDSALKLFLSKGFAEVTMAEIAASSGITAGTIYRYFESKDALVGALVARNIDSSWTRGPEIAAAYGTKTARDVLAMLLHRWADQFEKREPLGLLILLVREAPRFQSEVAQYTSQLLQVGCLTLERAIRHGIERGELDPNLEIEATGRALAAGIVDRAIWRATFGSHLPSLAPGVDPSRFAIDSLVRGLPSGRGGLHPRVRTAEPVSLNSPMVLAAESEKESGGLRIINLRRPKQSQ